MADFFMNIKEYAMKLVSSLRWYDILDILVVATVLYSCIRLFRKTRAVHLVRGFVLIGFIYIVVSALNMSTSSFLLSRLFNDIVIVIVLLFQPEFRQAIESFGRGDFKKVGLFSRDSVLNRREYENTVTTVVKAATNMGDSKTGALIVIEGKTPLGEIIATGNEIDAKITVPIIENIFFDKSPLHDGAMVLRNNRICAAACILPLTKNEIGRELGTRHRAAVGISEHSDALVVVVSEETGAISVARNGRLERDLSPGELYERLTGYLLAPEDEKRPHRRKKQ